MDMLKLVLGRWRAWMALACFGVALIPAQSAYAVQDGDVVTEILKAARSTERGRDIEGAPIGGPVPQPDAMAVCPLDFTSEVLALSVGEKYGRIDYEMGSDCRMVRLAVVRSSVAPNGSQGMKLVSSSSERAATGGAELRPGAFETASGMGTPHACRIEVWEEDVVAIRMITVTDFVSWEADGGRIPSARAQWNAFSNLDWWFKDGDLGGGIRYVSEPYTATTWVTQGFLCDGAGPISRYVCSGPSYRIQLHGNLHFDGGGNCSGQAFYSGTIVPAGRVAFEVTRQ